MSLERFRRSRLVVLHSRSTTYEAARAMADNHIGAVLVAEEQRVVGLVTDRDLALEVMAGDLDPRATPLRDVMSDEVATVDVGAGVDQVVSLMSSLGVRRVPLTEGGRPVGMITLDDLLLEGVIDAAGARSILVAQLQPATRLKPEGALHPEEPARASAPNTPSRAGSRRRARAENAYGRLLRAVEHHSGLKHRAHAELALEIVLGALCRRVTPQEARHLVAQLPSKLQPELSRRLDGPDRRVTTEAIAAELQRHFGVDGETARNLIVAVCEAIAEGVSAGEIEAFRGQLPLVMRELFPPTPLRRAS